MYTIDEFIRRLTDLCNVSPRGGETPVLITAQGHTEIYEPAAAEVRTARENVDDEGHILFNQMDGEPAVPVIVLF